MKEFSMSLLSESRLSEIFNSMKDKHLVVIGDLMIDRYIWGSVSRISPEAPVPVIEVTEENERLGGAANVGNNIVSLGGKCTLIGVVGNDINGNVLKKLVEEMGMNSGGIVTDSSRMTTVKTRVIALQQHVVRIDHEQKNDISPSIVSEIINHLEKNISNIDGIILEDYNKGVLTKELIKSVTELANKHNKLVAVDPKLNHFLDYKNVTVFKPNLKETSEGLGRKIKSEEEVKQAGNELLDKLQAKHVLITRSEKGMSLFSSNGKYFHVPTHAREVADVSGAGDTVIATMTLALAANASAEEAASLANLAGGLVVGEVGIVPAEPQKILEFRRKLDE